MAKKSMLLEGLQRVWLKKWKKEGSHVLGFKRVRSKIIKNMIKINKTDIRRILR